MDWHDPQHDALDELLHTAHWPDPELGQLERLNREWHRLVWQRRRRVMFTSLAAAALLPIAVWLGSLAFVHDRRPVEVEIAKPTTVGPPRVVQEKALPALVAPSVANAVIDEPTPEPQYVRDPNVLEQALVRIHRHKVAAQRRVESPPQKEVDRVDPVEVAVQRVIDEPSVDLATVSNALLAANPDCEQRLRQMLDETARMESTDLEQSTARNKSLLRLLAAVATPASLPVLIAAARQEDCPVDVLQAVARHSNVSNLTVRVREETFRERQCFWLKQLLERHTAEGMAAFLELAGQPPLSAAAVDAARSVDSRAFEALFGAMFSSRVATRMTAARVLGELNDPLVSKRLAQMALENVGRREALVALLQSSDPVAHQFLSYAQNDLTLAPSLRAISVQLSETNSLN